MLIPLPPARRPVRRAPLFTLILVLALLAAAAGAIVVAATAAGAATVSSRGAAATDRDATTTGARGAGHALPAGGPLERARRVRATLAGDERAAAFADHDLTAAALAGGGAALAGGGAALAGGAALDGVLPDSLRAELARLASLAAPDPAFAGAAAMRSAGEASLPRRDAPWSASHLLADATQMNDRHLSLARAPSGALYAVFEATDLGGTDRDIHIARSLDGGATWQSWEMPSFSYDEYHPDLAIDAAGYLYVAWIREDGYLLRSRSAAPDDPLTWAWVRGLYTGETHATATIGVSGAGLAARVFIAAGWLTINWDLYASEWTLIWCTSTNGGETIDYDGFLPDGYPDYWPDVQLDGGVVYLANAEQDYYSGETEILLARGALGGTFEEPFYCSTWTPFDCGFPSVAADGGVVHLVFQMDYEDGTGGVDGDAVYCFSDDDLAGVYGPYEMVCDDWNSLGPVLYADDGLVGCLWLDAPPGADEFGLYGRQAAGYGHPDLWQDVETILADAYVDPSFHAAAGCVGDGALHAAWIDKRDYTTQGFNVYTSERACRPELSFFAPSGWGGAVVANLFPGERETGIVAADHENYLSFAFMNDGLADVTGDFTLRASLDGVPLAAWTCSGGLPTGTWAAVEDHPFTASAGSHLLGVWLDADGTIDEPDETDNILNLPLVFVTGEAELRLEPAAITHQFLRRGPSPGEVDRLVAAPPLTQRASLPVMAPRLAAACDAAAPGERLRVVVEPVVRVDAPALVRDLEGLDRGARRAALRAALKGHAEKQRAWLADLLAARRLRGEADEPAALWLSGSLVCAMTADAARELAAAPGVGRLWLDDRLSEPLAIEAAQGARASGARADAGRATAWQLTRIGADQVWAQGFDGAGVLVAHIDTGVAWDHPDLAGHLWDGGAQYPNHGWDCLDEDADPYDGDAGFWHGTHTAGCVVGGGESGTATGVAPGARLIALRCTPGYFQDYVEGLQFALDHEADLVTGSAGWIDPEDDLREAHRWNGEVLLAAGLPWIGAAGNGDGTGGHYPAPRDIVSPADSPHPAYGGAGHGAMIAVGAATQADGVHDWSSRGPTEWAIAGTYGYDDYPWPPGLIKPDLLAPGDGVTSTVVGGYADYSGSSMAAPQVAGACALLLQARPGASVQALAQALEDGAVDLGAAGRDNDSGAGRLDIPAALAALPAGAWESFAIHDDGMLPLQVTGLTWQADWLSVEPAGAMIDPGGAATFQVVIDADGLAEGVYEDVIHIASSDPDSPHALPVTVIVGDMTAAPNGDAPVAAPAALSSWPNPFNPSVTLRFVNPRPGPVRLTVHDARGRLLRVLVDEALPAGAVERAWDGRDARGHALPSGVYLARVETADGAASRKLLLVK
ncbi:MAG: S8 family serine peptidase [Candidatus Krumholzibacteriota bacterium]|nr:S8 family serine peptidase [Candidatus Krumholzibacteriota bacterium]